MKKTTPIEQQVDKHKALLEKQKELIRSFHKGKLEKYEGIAPLDYKFQVIVYNHLQQLLKDT